MEPLHFSNIRTYPIKDRPNLVHLSDLIAPEKPPAPFESPELDEVVDRIIAARTLGRPVIWMMGAHVIKSGLSKLIIELMEHGCVTHLAGNGAVSIHDFELALIGATSEDVARGIEDGSFGMAEETGALMHRALRLGGRDGLGYGESLGRFMAENPGIFPYAPVSLSYQAYRLGIPLTVHVTIGTDIIHQHPQADFGLIGATSGIDFQRFTTSVSQLEDGVYLNFGSAVTGPEVFLKAITIARNLGYKAAPLTTANFDLRPLPDYHAPIQDSQPDYYYRPRKNVINRPTSLGGAGYHITGDHKVTIPNLYHRLVSAHPEPFDMSGKSPAAPPHWHPALEALAERQPALVPVLPELTKAFEVIWRSLRSGSTLYLGGNGGSMADALHISAELLKSYARPRLLPASIASRLELQLDGDLLKRNLQPGLRAVVLGANLSLSSAVANDLPDRDTNLAQELLALARIGDVFLGLSTSGNARNVCYAAQVARALGLSVIAFTGQEGGRLATLAEISIRVPAVQTDRIQELHILGYHALCEMLEGALIEANQTR
jgi:phosphoheptose isomerase